MGNILSRLSSDKILSIIKEVLYVDGVHICYIFGSYGTSDFGDFSDIDIAVITDLDFCELGVLEDELSNRLGISVDLVNINSLNNVFKFQIACRGDILFCRDECKLDKFLYDMDVWYKTDYNIFKSWKESEW